MKKTEIRKDYIHDRFVLIVPSREKRPHDIPSPQERPVSSKNCPFCKTKFKKQKGIFTVKKNGDWKIKVVKNAYPIVTLDNIKAKGVHELVVETPKHNLEFGDFSLNHIVEVLKVFAQRTKVLSKIDDIKYIIIFKNNGGKAGASLVHAHSQILALSFLSPHIVNKLARAQRYRIKNGTCYYCDLLKKEEKGPRKVYSDKNIVVFCPYASTYNYEIWMLPKKHIDNITYLSNEEYKSFAKALKKIIQKLDKNQIPYNLYLHQAVTDREEHFYIRICPRKNVWGGVEVGSRLYVNTVSSEDAAKFYKKK
ncbi:MAG: DUF4931 domain-containing protein [Candidatus Omnitrophica bacterium]|nr:DUF4931 domain-containing protein [Candidatus Omnitrophota bacterium]